MRGRPSKYKTYVEPYLDDIEKMALDMTEEQIAETLHVSYSTFREYKRQYPALNDKLNSGRRDLVLELKGLLIKKARGYNYDEEEILEDGMGNVKSVKKYKRYAKPDTGAIHLLLKNYDKSWSDNPKLLEIKREEVELKRQVVEFNTWQGEIVDVDQSDYQRVQSEEN